MACCRFCIRGENSSDNFGKGSVKNHSTFNPVSTASVRFSGVYLSLTVTLLQEQKQKHYLNQGSGSFTLHGLESKPGSEGVIKGNLEFAPDKHVKKAPWAKPSEPDRTMFWSANDLHETGRQRRATLVHFVDIVQRPLDVKPFCRLGYLRITARADQTWCFLFSRLLAHCFSRKMVCFGVTLPSLPSFLFGILSRLPFVSLSFLFIDSEISVEAAIEDQKSCSTLASFCCLTLSYFLLSTFFFLFLLSRSSLKSSSAPLLANVKNLTGQRGDSRWCPPLFLLAGSMFFVWQFSALTVFFLDTEIQSQHWLWCKKDKKIFLKIQSRRLDTIFYRRWRGHVMFQRDHWG